MKKLLFAVALTVTSLSFAQQLGIKGGFNYASLANLEDSSAKIGYNAGVFVHLPLAGKVSIQPELLYTTKGANEDGNSNASINMEYLSLPVMLQYNVTPQFYVEAGPEFSLLLTSEMKEGGMNFNIKEHTENIDYGVAVGAGYYFFSKLGITARYVFGLADNFKNNPSFNDETITSQVFQLGLAYKF